MPRRRDDAEVLVERAGSNMLKDNAVAKSSSVRHWRFL